MSVESGGLLAPSNINNPIHISSDKTSNKNSEEMVVDRDVNNTAPKKNFPQYRFRTQDPGPFSIIIESKREDGKGVSRLHPMAIGKLLHENHKEISNNIISITKLGINRLKVEVSNAISGNKLLDSIILKEKDFTSYIPTSILLKKGIIRGVDSLLSENEIIEVIKGPQGNQLEIINLRRIHRKIKIDNGEEKKVPTQSIFVTIRGQILPTHVYIHYVSCRVDPYIDRVIQCEKCYRYGHITNQCKGRTRCGKCSGEHESSTCTSEDLKCVHCKQSHASNNHSICPQFKKERCIKEMMSSKVISYFEAKQFVEKKAFSTVTKQDIPQIQDNEAFPALSPNEVFRPWAPTSNFPRSTKRLRSTVSPQSPIIPKDSYFSIPVPKNEKGGIIKNASSKDFKAIRDSQEIEYETICEIVFSIIENLIKSKEKLSNSDIKEIIKDRVNHLAMQ